MYSIACHSCVCTRNDFEKMTYYHILHSLRTAIIREFLQKMRENIWPLDSSREFYQGLPHKKAIEDTLKDYFLDGWESFLKNCCLAGGSPFTDRYSLLNFDQEQNVFVVVYKLFTYGMMRFCSSHLMQFHYEFYQPRKQANSIRFYQNTSAERVETHAISISTKLSCDWNEGELL